MKKSEFLRHKKEFDYRYIKFKIKNNIGKSRLKPKTPLPIYQKIPKNDHFLLGEPCFFLKNAIYICN